MTNDHAKPLPALRRFALVILTWGLIALSQPGVLRPDGFGHLAFFAIGPWAYAAIRPGRRAFLVEWAAHSLGLASVFAWMLAFLPGILPPMSIVPALYPAAAGALLRRTSGRAPLALTAAAAWMLAEVLRWSLPVPLSFGWFRLGMLMHDTEWIVGSAAVFGTFGLTWGMAALGGFGADVVRALTRPEGTPSRLVPVVIFGLGPLIALVAIDAQQEVRTVPGPDLLIVQPGIEQQVKATGLNPFTELYVPQVERTRQAILDTAREREPFAEDPDAHQPDLVLWGETFLPGKLFPSAARQAYADGARPSPIARSRDLPLIEATSEDAFANELALALLGKCRMRETLPRYWRATFGDAWAPEWTDRVVSGEPLLPPGTWFLSGLESWAVRDTGDTLDLASLNAAALWAPDGTRSLLAGKIHVVPGGESIEPLRFIPFVVDAIQAVANNVPDFVAADEPGVLEFQTRNGQTYRFGVAICFDNAFEDPFTEPLRRSGGGGPDFFVVASNEAWYKRSPLMDHMLAFTRIAAAGSQRSIVRATNSGISAVVGPDGAVTSLLEVEGERKMVAGVLRARVPVLASRGDKAGAITFFARTEHRQPWAWAGISLLILLISIAARGRGHAPASGAAI